MYTNGANFFKYITTEACTDRLKIPVDHRWNKEMEFPNRVILEDKHGNTWPVKLKVVEDQVCFVGGWLKFVKDNCVEEGNFLVFVNSEPNILSFRLYDSAARCETGGIFSGMNSVNQEGESSEFEHQTRKTYCVGKENEEVEVGKENEEVEEEMEVEEMKYERSLEEEEKEDDDVDKDHAEDAFKEEVEQTENDDEEGNDDDKEEEEDDDNGEDADEEEEDDNPKEEISVPGENIGHNHKGTSKQSRDIYGKDIFRVGGIPLPKNPYFVTCIRIRRQNELHVPTKLVKDYKLELPRKAMIRDARGREWKTKLMFWKDGRILYSGGWASFCRVNLVEDHELFICEFVHGDGVQPLTLSVYKV